LALRVDREDNRMAEDVFQPLGGSADDSFKVRMGCGELVSLKDTL
jgi:hypothetical protein